jgi:tight adherence protein B
MPVVMVFALLWVAPGYLQGMVADPDGKWLIVGAVGGQFLGYYFIRRIVNIKV